MKRKIVEVKWFDAQSTTDQMSIKEIEEFKPVKSHSIGYLIEDNKEYIVLGFTDFGEEDLKHIQVIPRGMIEEINIIRKEELKNANK